MFDPVFHGLNRLDIALGLFLVLVFPLLQLVTSLWRRHRGERSLIRRYLRNSVILGVPLIVLAADWIGTGRTALALGLDMPISQRGLIGLGIAALLIVAMLVITVLQPIPSDPEKRIAMARKMKGGGLLPDTRTELTLAMVYGVIVGCGGELLFRAFLLWLFVPLVGLATAVIVAALAYGIGHGYRNRREALMSLVSAFAFTLAYAFTFSIWWLMAIHTAAALQGAWAGYRLARAHRN